MTGSRLVAGGGCVTPRSAALMLDCWVVAAPGERGTGEGEGSGLLGVTGVLGASTDVPLLPERRRASDRGTGMVWMAASSTTTGSSGGMRGSAVVMGMETTGFGLTSLSVDARGNSTVSSDTTAVLGSARA